MKPKEFDELIRQKFDQSDFAYDPDNWDKLAEKLDGNAKKRSIILWWWAPLAGMAASVALAFGVSSVMRQAIHNNVAGNIAHTQKSNTQESNTAPSNVYAYIPQTAQNETAGPDIYASAIANNGRQPVGRRHKHAILNKTGTGNIPAKNTKDRFAINFENATKTVFQAKPVDLLSKNSATDIKKKQVVAYEGVSTFKQEEVIVKKAPKLSVILTGGMNQGKSSGYMAGASIRRMVSDKVYVEGALALASSNNTQSIAYSEQYVVAAPSTGKKMNTGKTTSDLNKTPAHPTVVETIKQKDVSYDLYYAQITPSIGYKLMKRMSIGVGPDFQRMLVDNRPAPSTVERGTIQVAPVFDVGFIGKGEYALTKNIRAGVFYRKGVNNVITPMGKFIDRDYLQFQVKYTIFNR